MRLCRVWPALLGLAAVVGCGDRGPKAPATYSAGGKVVFADGQPMAGATVQFQAPDGGATSAIGEAGADGTFSLNTIFNGKKLPGAAEGSYRVTVLPPLGTDQAARPRVAPVTLPDPYAVKPGAGNDFILTMPRPR